jgi:hypothetical protein
MSLFGTILEKLGIGTAHAEVPTTAPPVPRAAAAPAALPAAPSAPAPASAVNVAARLELMAAHNPQELNWKTSIVDLMKLLGLDSSFAARKTLATELGCPAELLGDSARMNVWLHKAVLKKIAEHGGTVPPELL